MVYLVSCDSWELTQVLNHDLNLLDEYAQLEQEMILLLRYCPLTRMENVAYNYLYLDPRVLREDFHNEQPEDATNFHCFLKSVFYIGKGTNKRATVTHLKDT